MRAATPLALLAALLASPLPAADLDVVKQRGVLRVIATGDIDGRTPGRSRFIFDMGGTVGGLEGEILTSFARLHGLRVEMVRVPTWDRIIPALLQDQGDLAAGGMTDTAGRRQQVGFTAETFPTRHVVVTRKPHRVVRTLEELREERVGVGHGTSNVEAVLAAGVPRENISEFSSASLSTRDALKQGRVSAIVEGVERALTADPDDPLFQLGMFLGPPQSLAFAVRKEDVRLQAALNEYLANLRRTPTWNRLVVKYFGEKALDVLKQVRQR